MRVLVSGAAGFVGRALCKRLVANRHAVRGLRTSRRAESSTEAVEYLDVGPLEARPPLESSLNGVEVVFHLAGRAHVTREQAADVLGAYRKVNVEGTIHLADAAARAGVRRLVFLSSIKVLADATPGSPLTEDSPPRTDGDPYGTTKREAEEALEEIGRRTGLEVVILRCPLVYGPHVRANFLSLLRAVDRRLPLPLASVSNRRSLIFVDNLADALVTSAVSPAASGETFLVADTEVVSTPELIERIGAALGRTPRLFAFPLSALRAAARFAGRTAVAERLISSLEVATTKAREVLEWNPPHTMDTGLRETANWYHSLRAGGRRRL